MYMGKGQLKKIKIWKVSGYLYGYCNGFGIFNTRMGKSVKLWFTKKENIRKN